jgi:hypothetical protein
MSFALLSDRKTFAASGAVDLRRQIDRSVSRALFDDDYAHRLLSDPTIALEESGCPLPLRKSLSNIHAIDVVDFARQARALFWRTEPTSYVEDQLPLAVAAR